MGEFAWGICEPQEGQYDFAWLRRVMDLMGEVGIQVVLGTPTAAPPIWLSRKHPEILPLDERGLPYERRHPAGLLFEQRSVTGIIPRKLSAPWREALGKHPQLIAWQIHNNAGHPFDAALLQPGDAAGLARLAAGQV